MSDFHLGRQLGTYSVYVSNLHIDTKKEDLLGLFKDCGKVSTTFVAKITDRPIDNIYGFVRFFEHEHALTAVEEMHNWSYRGMKLTVELSTETTERLRAKGLIPSHGYGKSVRSSSGIVDNHAVMSLTMNNLMHESRLHDICAEINKQQAESGSDYRLEAEKILSNVSRLQCKKMLPFDGSLVGETKGNLTHISKNMLQREKDGDIPRNSTKTFLAILKEVLDSVHATQPEVDLEVKTTSSAKFTNTMDSIVSNLFGALEKIVTKNDSEEEAPHRDVVPGGHPGVGRSVSAGTISGVDVSDETRDTFGQQEKGGSGRDTVTDCKVKSDCVTDCKVKGGGVTDCKVKSCGVTDCNVRNDGATDCKVNNKSEQPMLDSREVSLHISKADIFLRTNISMKCVLQKNNYKAVSMDGISLTSTGHITSAQHEDQDVENQLCISNGVPASIKTSVLNECLCEHMTSSEDDEDRYQKFCELTGQAEIAEKGFECPLEKGETILRDGSAQEEDVCCNLNKSRKSTNTSVSDSSRSSNDSLFVDLTRTDSCNRARNLSKEPMPTPTQTDFSGQLESLLKCDVGLSQNSDIKIVHNHSVRHSHHGPESTADLPLRRPHSIPQAALPSRNCVPGDSRGQSSYSSSSPKGIQGDGDSYCSREHGSRRRIPNRKLPSIGRGLSSILGKLKSMEARTSDPVGFLDDDLSIVSVGHSALGALGTSNVAGEQERTRRNPHSRTGGEVLKESGLYSPSKSERRFRPLKLDRDTEPTTSVNPTCAPLTRGRGRGQLSDRFMVNVRPPGESSGTSEQINRGLVRNHAERDHDKSPCGDVAADSGVESDSLNTNFPLPVVQHPVPVPGLAGDAPNKEYSLFEREDPVKSYVKTLIGRGRGIHTEESNSKRYETP